MNQFNNYDKTLPELDVSRSLLVDYDSKSNDYKWNSFGFPIYKWEMANLSDIYSTSALNFYVKGKVPKIQITLISYLGKKRRISKIINENNIREVNEDLQIVTIPFKSFKDFDSVDWSNMKELRFKILETSKFEMGDFNIVEFRGNFISKLGQIMRFLRLFVVLIISLCFLNVWTQSSVVEIKESNNKFQFYKNGKPYYTKGAGAKSNFKKIVESGGNSIRLWSTNKSSLLDSAQKYGLSVCQGIWIAQERNGFDYNDDYNVKGQIELIKKEILRVKDHPSIIIWGIGNEVDLKYSNFRVWETIEEIAKFIKKLTLIILL